MSVSYNRNRARCGPVTFIGMKRIAHSIVVPLLIGLFLGCAMPAQQTVAPQVQKKKGHLVMEVDHSTFRADAPDSIRLEVYYKIYNFGFKYREVDSRYVADYRLLVTVEDESKVQVGRLLRERSISVPNEHQTRSLIDFRTSIAAFTLTPGTYRVSCYLADINGEGESRAQFSAKLREYDYASPRLSNVLFAHTVTSQDDDDNVFNRGSTLRIVPSVSRDYGSDTEDKLLYYLEIYEGRDDWDKVVVETRIRHEKRDDMVYRDTLTANFDDPVKRQLREISLAQFKPGPYALEIRLFGRREKYLDDTRALFYVHWDEGTLIQHDAKTAIQQLELITSGSELDAIKVATTPEARQKAYDEFWAKNDPTPGTLDNEWQREFNRRVAYANRHFEAMRREGWRTDRGRIYIQRGEPDQIDDVPMSPSYPPYQIWHYYQVEALYRRYTFVDENFDGDYRLIFPYDGLGFRPEF